MLCHLSSSYSIALNGSSVSTELRRLWVWFPFGKKLAKSLNSRQKLLSSPSCNLLLIFGNCRVDCASKKHEIHILAIELHGLRWQSKGYVCMCKVTCINRKIKRLVYFTIRIYRQYINLFIFRFVFEHCLRSTLRLCKTCNLLISCHTLYESWNYMNLDGRAMHRCISCTTSNLLHGLA